MKTLIAAITILVGMALTEVITKSIPTYANQETQMSVSQATSYKAFSPLNRDVEKHLLVGNCTLHQNAIGNDFEHNLAPLEYEYATYAEILTYVRKRTSKTNAAFYDFGNGGIYQPEQLLFLYHGLHLHNVKSILYTNLFGHSTDLYDPEHPGSILETVNLLEKLKKEYPTAQEFIKIYYDYLVSTKRFHNAEKQFGNDWRNLIDPETMTLKSERELREANFLTGGFSEVVLRKWFSGLLSLKEILIATGSSSQKDFDRLWDEHISTALQKVKETYSDPLADQPFVDHDSPVFATFFDGPEGKIRLNNFRLMAALAKARGVYFAPYFPPIASFTPKFYREVFVPHYISVVQAALKPFGFDVIDHVESPELNVDDYLTRPLDWNPAIKGKLNAIVNIVGNVKRGTLLLDELHRRGLLSDYRLKGSEIETYLNSLPKVNLPIRREIPVALQIRNLLDE